MSDPQTYYIKTLGCKANWVDSQEIESALHGLGLRSSGGSDPDVVVVNSCTVTDEADKESLRAARRLRRKFPRAKILYAGCSAEVNPSKAIALAEVDAVFSNREKAKLSDPESAVAKWLHESKGEKALGQTSDTSEILSKHPMDRVWPTMDQNARFLKEKKTQRTRAFLKIQDGCNAFCTFCIIPYGRGPSRSLSISEVVSRVQLLVASGYKEVVITGINLGDYGIDLGIEKGRALEALLEALCEETDIERIRLSSLDPTEITDGILEKMALNSKLCPHLHVSLQSPLTPILRGMKRGYTSEEVKSKLERIASIRVGGEGIFVGMDVITGFPGETVELFQESLEKFQELPWQKLHVFPYSERKGTPATRLPKCVAQSERVTRSRALNLLSLQRMEAHYQKAPKIISDVLLEGSLKGPSGEAWRSGYSRHYLRVIVRESDLSCTQNSIGNLHNLGVVLDRHGADVMLIGSLEPIH